MSKIITVTAHSAIDLLIEAEGLYQRDNLVAKKSREFACGKGINVGKAAESLGHSAVCLGFAGRQSLGSFDALNTDLLQVDLIAVEGKTRTNVTLSDPTAGRETHIRTSGYRVTPEDCLRLAEKLGKVVQAGDIVVFAGSLPPGAPGDLYRTLIGICREKSALSILDSSGAGLAEGIQASPDLIKPNLQELEALAGRTLNDTQDALEAAFALLAGGVARVCVSLGAQGAVAAEGSRAFAACAAPCSPEKATQIGCGDALVAGLAAGLLRRLPWEDCVGLGIACGTANLYSAEPGRFSKSKAGEILRQVRLTPMPYGSG